MHVPRRPLAWLLPLAFAASPLFAQEWHESYRNGVRALANGQAQRAVTLLEHAASQRPQPGRNVITYGTNVEPRYYPYLRLAEAYLRLDDRAGARSALKRSESWGIEPAAERARLQAQLEPAAPAPSPTAAPTPPPTPVPPPPAAEKLVEPPPVSAPTVAPATPGPRLPEAAPPTRRPPAETSPVRPPATSPAPPASAPTAAGTLEIVSHPPGAAVYLDDQRIGTTDPEWGRLLETGVAPGRHRLRLALDGHGDVSEEIEVRAGAVTDVRRRLPENPSLARRAALPAVVVAVLLGLTALALRRQRVVSPASPLAPTPVPLRTPAGGFDSVPTPVRGTPPAVANPGVVRDPDGVEWFGDYRLLEPLGRGGMASVYKAERRGERVALKRPLPTFLDEPEFLERFLREAEIGRSLHHPNIVRILERGEAAGVPYFTMELVEGETLQARLKRTGALEPRAAAAVVVQVAEALDYAHLKGVVHRDLKPSNIMVQADGVTRVMDYGIARARRFEGLTVTGAFLGSPEYVAPEAIEGRDTDARSDLYSLGVVFYEILTGQRPFAGDTPFAVLRKHLSEEPPALRTLAPAVPPDLERIVLRLLRKRPEERYPGADELLQDLRDYLNRAA